MARRVPSEQTTRGRLLHREEDEFDGAGQLEVSRRGLVLASGADTAGFWVEGLEPEPSAIGSEPVSTRAARWKNDMASRHDMRGLVRPATPRRLAAAGIAVVAELHDRDRLADHEAVARQDDMLVEHATPRAERVVVGLSRAGDLMGVVVQ